MRQKDKFIVFIEATLTAVILNIFKIYKDPEDEKGCAFQNIRFYIIIKIFNFPTVESAELFHRICYNSCPLITTRFATLYYKIRRYSYFVTVVHVKLLVSNRIDRL